MLLPSSNLLQQRHIQSQPQIQQSRFPGIVDNDIVSDPFVVDEISPSGFGQDLYSLTQPRQPATYLSSRQLTVPSHPHTVDPSKFSLFSTATSPSTSDDYLSLSQLPDLMSSESWPLASHYTPKSFGRMPHQRESSLSSLGSAGPASPYNHTVTNPHIATAEPASDGFSDMQAHDGSNSYYQLTKAVGSQGGMFSGYHNLNTMEHPEMGYPAAITLHRPRTDRTGLLPAPDFGNGHNRSRPTSVASSTVGGDSPATPSLGEPGDDDRRRMRMTALTEPPKLDRTMTDIYSDELYNPSFTITSASPSHPQQMVLSPSNDVFAQRLSAANNQHLSASQSPTSSVSRDRSPFRHGSPHAPMSQEFGGVFATSRLRFNSAHEMREHDKAAQDARMLKQQIATKAEPETPRTISPKDAMLDFPGPDSESVFPSLFPTQETTSDFGANDQTSKSTASTSQLALFPQHQHQHNSGYSYLPHQQLPASVHIPQQYPFIAHPHQSHHESPPNLTSAGSSTGSSVNTPVNAKPAGATADGGTYTCTYHGCSLRFETPALLQKHKREGHRQPQGLAAGGIRHSDGDSSVSDSFLNTQAGPHRCDRVNPSTGKPCNTIFSRPYDLTRHEDTIHNARKQKVRCNLCTEEKTFSRADALTRHYRVCHPDVELPGKYRRRGHHG